MSALFHSTSVRIGDDRKSVIVEGRLEDGSILPGMLLTIAFNRSFGMSVPISDVIRSESNKMTLVLDCEDSEGAEFVEAMNFGDELMEVESSATA